MRKELTAKDMLALALNLVCGIKLCTSDIFYCKDEQANAALLVAQDSLPGPSKKIWATISCPT